MDKKAVQFGGNVPPPSPKVDFSKNEREYPEYYYLTAPATINGNLTLGNSTIRGPVFNIHNGFCNLSRSILEYDIVVGQVPANEFAVKHALGETSIFAVSLKKQGGENLVDLTNFDIFSNVVNPYVFSSEEAQSTGDPLNSSCGIHQNGGVTTDIAGVLTRIDAATDRPATGDAYSRSDEIVYGQAGNSAANGTSRFRVRMPLKYIAHSIFSLDRDLPCYGMQFSIFFNAKDKFLYTTRSATDHADTPVTIGNVAVTIENIELRMAVEKNPMIIKELDAMYNSGKFVIDIDYAQAYPLFSTGAFFNQPITIDTGLGNKLKRIYWATFPQARSLNTQYNHSNNVAIGGNIANSLVSSYNTYLNGVELQQGIINTALYNDYSINKPNFIGTCINNSDVYKYNWVHIDRWDDIDSLGQNESQGIPLKQLSEGVVKWSMKATVRNIALEHYVYAIFERGLKLSPSGSEWV